MIFTVLLTNSEETSHHEGGPFLSVRVEQVSKGVTP